LLLANTYYAFRRRYPWLAPAPSAVRWTCIRRLLKLGGKYMIMQLAALGIYQSQAMIITQILGPSQVVISWLPTRSSRCPWTWPIWGRHHSSPHLARRRRGARARREAPDPHLGRPFRNARFPSGSLAVYLYRNRCMSHDVGTLARRSPATGAAGAFHRPLRARLRRAWCALCALVGIKRLAPWWGLSGLRPGGD
jgi:hypothetical protein